MKNNENCDYIIRSLIYETSILKMPELKYDNDNNFKTVKLNRKSNVIF